MTKKCEGCRLMCVYGELKLCSYCDHSNQLYRDTPEYQIVEFLRQRQIKLNYRLDNELPPEFFNQKIRKEIRIVNFVKNSNIDFTHNKSIGINYGDYRPDILIECKKYFIIVEVDERAHRYYDKICENVRMANIKLALDLPCIFLRYNPDCFYCKTKKYEIDTEKRQEILLGEIMKYMEKRREFFRK